MPSRSGHSRLALGAGLILAVAGLIGLPAVGTYAAPPPPPPPPGPPGPPKPPHTTTPIQHLVVIFQENVSFDHYFGTYPVATNTGGQPFTAAPGTPSVNGLTTALKTANPNGVNPRRYDPTAIGDLLTCDQDHNYNDEQRAFDNGLMDRFVATVGTHTGSSPTGQPCVAGDVMNYYDGNTVTALWNYAQQFAMSDNSFGTTFGPSAPGAVNLVSGDTGNVDTAHEVNAPSIATVAAPNADLTADGLGGYSLTSDAQPYWDDCSTRDAVALSGQNVGDELNAAGLSWGWFQGGFRPTTTFAAAAAAVHPGQATSTFTPDEFSGSFTGKVVPAHASNQALCDAVTPVGPAIGGTGQYGYKDDYIAHHEPFQYYSSTANPHHLTLATDASGHDTTAALATVGTDTQSFSSGYGVGPQFNTPNHQYDTSDFDQLVQAINAGTLPPSALPAVSFLKAPGFQDGHAAYSNPIDEQQWLVREINALEAGPDWSSTAVIINYDDSDGWYDHAYSGVTNPSTSVADALTGVGACGTGTPLAGEQGRCGYGPRLPLIVISPYAKSNFVDHTLTDQSSILRFVEDNWSLPRIAGSTDARAGSIQSMFNFKPGPPPPPGKGQYFLNAATGQPVPPNPTCSGTFLYTVLTGNVTVPSGATCKLDGSTAQHDVNVQPGGTLILVNGSNVEGDVHAMRGASVQVSNSTIGHDLALDSITGSIAIAGTTVGHDLNANNSATVSITANTISHDLNVMHNASATVTGNAVGHMAHCQGNAIFTGSGNGGGPSCNTGP